MNASARLFFGRETTSGVVYAPKNRWVLALALALALALVTTACDSGTKKSGTPAPADQAATGTPLAIGLINQEDSPDGSFPEYRREAEAAVAYVNAHLNGINGHPIDLHTCVTNGSPESSQACANKLRDEQVVAVLGGVDLGAADSLPVLEDAKIPYISTSPALGDELTNDDAFMLTGGTAADLLGQASYITDTLHFTKVGILYVDLPGLLTTAVAATKQVLSKKGVTLVNLVPAKADARDMTQALAQVNEGNPQAIVSVFPAQACARIMQDKVSLDIKAKMFYPGVCADESVLAAAGDGASDAYFASGFLPYTDRSDPDVATYLANTNEKKSALSQSAFGAVMDIRSLLAGTPDPITPPLITKRLNGTKAQAGFMSHDYTCNGDQVALLTSICNPNVRLFQYRNGTFADLTGSWVNGADLVKLFTG